MKHDPRDQPYDDRQDGLAGQRSDPVVEVQEVLDARACLSQRREDAQSERASPAARSAAATGPSDLSTYSTRSPARVVVSPLCVIVAS
jgi:hypothetical protein